MYCVLQIEFQSTVIKSFRKSLFIWRWERTIRYEYILDIMRKTNVKYRKIIW